MALPEKHMFVGNHETEVIRAAPPDSHGWITDQRREKPDVTGVDLSGGECQLDGSSITLKRPTRALNRAACPGARSLSRRRCDTDVAACASAVKRVRHPPQSGWLSEWGRLKGGCSGCSVVALWRGERKPMKTPTRLGSPPRCSRGPGFAGIGWPEAERFDLRRNC